MSALIKKRSIFGILLKNKTTIEFDIIKISFDDYQFSDQICDIEINLHVGAYQAYL